MASRDPRLSPGLERSLPGDLQPGSTRVPDAPEPWSVQFGGRDKKWRNVRVRAWAADTRGHEVIEVEWHAGGDTRQGSFVADRAKMRKRW